MQESTEVVVTRLNKLGLQCDDVPTHQLCSATSALSCFPMYMVANVADWHDDATRERKLSDLFGIAAIRDAYAVGAEQAAFDINAAHSLMLSELFATSKLPLLIIYEYALETLRQFLAVAKPDLVELVKMAIARMMVAVAKASGEGWFGAGGVPTDDQRRCIHLISDQLQLRNSPTASVILEEIGA